MSKFVMKQRPKKPEEPTEVTYEVGIDIPLAYLQECVEKFKAENPGVSDTNITIDVDQNWGGAWNIFLVAPPESYNAYVTKLNAYKLELKEYKAWKATHKAEIEEHNKKEKQATAKRKLKRTQERLQKEMAKVEKQLSKT